MKEAAVPAILMEKWAMNGERELEKSVAILIICGSLINSTRSCINRQTKHKP